MSLTKNYFESELEYASIEIQNADWQEYEEYLYQQFAFEEPIEEMFAYFHQESSLSVAKELIANRNQEIDIIGCMSS